MGEKLNLFGNIQVDWMEGNVSGKKNKAAPNLKLEVLQAYNFEESWHYPF